MGSIFVRRTTNPGPREPDLGMNTVEIEDTESTTSYMDVLYPLDVKVVPASPNSSWLNLVFNEESERSSSAQTASVASQGIYSRKGSITPVTITLSSAAERTLKNQLPKLSSSSPECSLPLLSTEEKHYRGAAIAGTLQQQISKLVAAINPSETACRLYGFGIISKSERDSATLETAPKEQRSRDLMKNVIKKLKENPHWFDDACKALENAAVRSVIHKLQELVKKKWLEFSSDVEEDPKVKGSLSDSVEEGIHNSYIDDDDDPVLMLPSYQLSEIDLAYKSGGQDEVRTLIQSQSMEENNCLLQEACKEGVNPTILEVILSITPSLYDVNGSDEHGRTCLHIICAVSSKSKGAADFKTDEQITKAWKLLEGGADPRAQDEDGNTPLHMAVNGGNLEMSKVLLKHAPDLINIPNNDGRTVLHVSTMNQLPLLTAELAKCKRCNVYTPDKVEKTPLHYASLSGMVDLVKPLLNKCHRAEFVDAADCNGDTALHISSREGYKDVMKLLLKYNADTGLKNNEGKTSLDEAEEKGNFKAIKALLKKKYPIRWRFKLQRMTRLPTSTSLNSFKSEASSVCSDINVTTAEVDLDNIED